MVGMVICTLPGGWTEGRERSECACSHGVRKRCACDTAKTQTHASSMCGVTMSTMRMKESRCVCALHCSYSDAMKLKALMEYGVAVGIWSYVGMVVLAELVSYNLC